jgi:hypothetical protein
MAITKEKLIRALEDEGLKANALGQRYSAGVSLFHAAALINNQEECDEMRAQLHANLDGLLDCLNSIEMLRRQFNGM